MRLADQIIAEYKSGTPANAIAKKVGTTKMYVAQIVTEHLTAKEFGRKPKPVKLAPLPVVQPRKDTGKEHSLRVGAVERCRDCGGMVQMPCRLCANRQET